MTISPGEIAYQQAQSDREIMLTLLANVRTRSISLLGGAALFLSFSSGLGLISTDKTGNLSMPGFTTFVLMGVLVLILVGVAYVLWPISRGIEQWEIHPLRLSKHYKVVDHKNSDDFLKLVAETLEDKICKHKRPIRRRQYVQVAIAILVTFASLLVICNFALAGKKAEQDKQPENAVVVTVAAVLPSSPAAPTP